MYFTTCGHNFRSWNYGVLLGIISLIIFISPLGVKLNSPLILHHLFSFIFFLFFITFKYNGDKCITI